MFNFVSSYTAVPLFV